VSSPPVVIIGAGAAGLACARVLHAAGREFQIIERELTPGGRIATATIGDFRCDRGFQVLVDTYPEAQRCLDYAQLRLGRFEPGAIVRYRGTCYRISDPLRRPLQVLTTLRAPFVRIAQVPALHRLLHAPGVPQRNLDEHLQAIGISTELRNAFLVPWLAGIFLDSKLGVRSDIAARLMRLFATGAAALPAGGMHAIIDQLAAPLPPQAFRYGHDVSHLKAGLVTLANGEHIPASAIVVAVDPPAAARLLPGFTTPPGVAVTTVHLSLPGELPWDGRYLLLDGDDEGVAVAYAAPSAVAAGYAPPGQHVVSATILDSNASKNPDQAGPRVVAQLQRWFGPQHAWQILRCDHIRYAKPRQYPHDAVVTGPQWSRGIYLCGDHTGEASLDGALRSGRKAAEAMVRAGE